MPPGGNAGDTGLAADRTTLAWTRTALVAAALGALLLRTGLVHRWPLSLAAAAVALINAATIAVIGHRRASEIATRRLRGETVAAVGGIRLAAVLTAFTVALAAVSMVLS
jgi:hypothetical protein